MTPPCVGLTELFYAETALEVEQAKAICSLCPWMNVCCEDARERREEFGVWGGVYFGPRLKMASRWTPKSQRTHPPYDCFCEQCGETFAAMKTGARFCGKRCSNAHHRARRIAA